MSKKLISILIPFYNEPDSLTNIINEINLIENKIKSKYNIEILLLDNHSNDSSANEALLLSQKNNNIKLIRHSRNFGYQSNILSGYNNCNGDAAIQLDADGQDDPQIILDFIKYWEKGYEVVYGIRKNRKESIANNYIRKIFYRFLKYISEIDIPVDAGDFRLVDKKIIDLLRNFKEKNIYLRGLISYIGFSQIGIEYNRRKRKSGKSKFNFLQNIKLAFTAIISFSKKPLSIIFAVGLFVFILSLILSVFYLILYISGAIVVQGFTTLILIILLFFGMTFLFIGIIALYLGQIQDEVKNRPTYIIEKKNE